MQIAAILFDQLICNRFANHRRALKTLVISSTILVTAASSVFEDEIADDADRVDNLHKDDKIAHINHVVRHAVHVWCVNFGN